MRGEIQASDAELREAYKEFRIMEVDRMYLPRTFQLRTTCEIH